MAQSILRGRSRQQGFGYLVVLLIAMMLGVASSMTHEHLDTIQKREREQEWLFVGEQYRQAIMSYYRQSPNGLYELPKSLDDLVRDSRFVSVRRHLRRLYPDPLTGTAWRIIVDDQEHIVGVVSSSDMSILQKEKLSQMFKNNDIPTNYSDVKFEADIKTFQVESADEDTTETIRD